MASLNFVRRTVGDVLVLGLTGSLVVGEPGHLMRDEMQRLLKEEKVRKLLLNLSQLKRIDSTGVGQLFSAYTTAVNSGGQLKFCEPRPSIIEFIKSLRIPCSLPMYPNEASALADFTGAPPSEQGQA